MIIKIKPVLKKINFFLQMREFHEEKQMINEPAHKIIN